MRALDGGLFVITSTGSYGLTLSTTRMDKHEVTSGIDEMLDLFPILKERATQLAGTMSGGEQQIANGPPKDCRGEEGNNGQPTTAAGVP